MSRIGGSLCREGRGRVPRRALCWSGAGRSLPYMDATPRGASTRSPPSAPPRRRVSTCFLPARSSRTSSSPDCRTRPKRVPKSGAKGWEAARAASPTGDRCGAAGSADRSGGSIRRRRLRRLQLEDPGRAGTRGSVPLPAVSGWHSPVTVSLSVEQDRSMVTHGHPAPVTSSELIGRRRRRSPRSPGLMRIWRRGPWPPTRQGSSFFWRRRLGRHRRMVTRTAGQPAVFPRVYAQPARGGGVHRQGTRRGRRCIRSPTGCRWRW